MISPVVAAALWMKPRSMLTINQARKVDALKQGSPEFALMRSLGMRFRGIFRSRDPGKLDSWIDDADNSGLVAIERFARVLHRDLDAVYNAIELPWSNGQAEGQINPFKCQTTAPTKKIRRLWWRRRYSASESILIEGGAGIDHILRIFETSYIDG